MTDEPLAIFDSHCHAWRRWPYAPVPDEESRGSVEQLLYEMDQHSVAQALIVCAAIDKNPDNVQYVAAARDSHPGPDVPCGGPRLHVELRPTIRLAVPADSASSTTSSGSSGFAHYTTDENDGMAP